MLVKQNRSVSLNLLFMLTLCLSNLLAKNGIIPPSEFIGTWEGKGKIIVSWCQQDTLLFSLRIHSDGLVDGKVGDAQLINGFLRKNNWLIRKLGNPEYLIGGNLQGSLVAAEEINRKSLHYLMVDFDDGKLVGGCHTSSNWGHPFRNSEKLKKSMVMTCVDVVLRKN